MYDRKLLGDNTTETISKPRTRAHPCSYHASFSVVLHLNLCESIIQSFSKAYTVAITPTIHASAVLTLAEKAREWCKERLSKMLENFALF